MGKHERYSHHGNMVWVRSDLKGKHREHCLCFECKRFNAEYPENKCRLADHLYTFCRLTGCVTPMYECQMFEALKGEG
jgi:hypothetical protein